MKTMLKRFALIAMLALAGFTQSNCKQVKTVLDVIGRVLRICDCLCVCGEAYRGGGDGGITGGGGDIRCVNKADGRSGDSCFTVCTAQSLPGLISGGTLVGCREF